MRKFFVIAICAAAALLLCSCGYKVRDCEGCNKFGLCKKVRLGLSVGYLCGTCRDKVKNDPVARMFYEEL